MTPLIGSRGTRRSAGIRAIPEAPKPLRAPAPAVALPAPPARRVDAWLDPLAYSTAVLLILSSLFSIFRHGLGSADVGRVDLVFSFELAILLIFLRRRHARPSPVHDDMSSVAVVVGDPPSDDSPSEESSFDRGVREIRRTDPKFDPGRFAGYAAMVFRDTQRARTTRDIASLRDRVTPEMYGALQGQSDRLQNTHRVNRAAEIDITAEITEAWQEGDRDYLTAFIGGSIVDETGTRAVEEFWTFTRPAGLNFWMLSAIQAA